MKKAPWTRCGLPSSACHPQKPSQLNRLGLAFVISKVTVVASLVELMTAHVTVREPLGAVNVATAPVVDAAIAATHVANLLRAIFD